MEICRDECKRKGGGDLASIHSTEENNVVADLIRQRLESSEYKSRHFKSIYYLSWIGATCVNITIRGFAWFDGTPWDFSNWKPGARSFQDQLLYNVQLFRY